MTPRFMLAALFIGVPLLEIYLFIKIGGLIGAWPTVGLVVLTALAGVTLMREQGIATLRRARASLDRNELPTRELMEGAALLVGGALLLIPGFFTDVLGFLCLLPVSRRWLLRIITPRMRGGANVHVRRAAPRGGHDTRIIEGEYTRKSGK